MLGLSEIKRLKEIYNTNDLNLPANFYCSNWLDNAEKRRFENAEIKSVITSKIKSIFLNYKLVYSCFLTKRFDFKSKIHPHVDWQFVNEPDNIAFNIWTPLKDTNRLNGSMWVIPKSHSNYNMKRGPNTECIIPQEILKDKKDIYLKAGEALIYDTRLIHGSYPNKLPFKRIALASIVVPEVSSIFHHYKNPVSGEIYTYEVDDTFYIENCNFKRSETGWDKSGGLI